MKEYKYKTSFSAQIKPLISKDLDKYLSIASEANFRKYLPKDINFNEKIDFLGFAGEAFVGRRLNLNDDGVDLNESIRFANLFPMSFVDVEHDRNKICGVITNASYAEFGTGKELTLDEIKETKSPFSVVIGGIIWRIPNPSFAESVEESSDPSSENHNKFFLSWEVLFNEAKLIVMDKKQSNFEDGKIISDASEISKLESKLKAFGGTGYTEDGKRIGRVIIGDCIPTAVGIVESPAATVKPISIAFDLKEAKASMVCPECGEEVEMEDNIDDEKEHSCAKCGKKSMGKNWKSKADISVKEPTSTNGETNKNNENLKNSQFSNSQLKNPPVKETKDTKNSNKAMIKSRKDITDENLKEANASQIMTVLDTEIEKISNDFEEKKNKVENELKASNDKLADLQKKFDEGQAKITEITENLNKLVKANQDREQEEIFNTRMNYFDAEYDLSEEKIRNIVARKIKGADEKTYTEAKEEIELLLAAKKKSNKVFDKKSGKWVDKEEMKDEKKESKASVENKEENSDGAVDKAIENGEKTKTTVAATTTVTETLADKYAKVFGESGWEIDKRAFRTGK